MSRACHISRGTAPADKLKGVVVGTYYLLCIVRAVLPNIFSTDKKMCFYFAVFGVDQARYQRNALTEMYACRITKMENKMPLWKGLWHECYFRSDESTVVSIGFYDIL